MIYYYDSTMPGALQLSGTAGALVAILKAYLVTGAGAGAVATLTVAGGIATATYASGHPFRPGAIAHVAGATPAGLNGLKPILTAATNTVTFAAPGVPDGAATGTITSKLAPAGWSELYPGTANVLALKPAVPEATGCVLRVDDTGTTNARVRGYEAMADIATGVGPIPLDSQVSGGLWWPKSGAASAATRPWFLVADERGFYLAVSPQGTADRFTLLYAGDIASLKSGDAYGFLVSGNTGDRTAGSAVPEGCCGYSGRTARAGAYLARAHTGIGQALAVQRTGAHHTGTAADAYAGTANYAWGAYPNGPNNGLLVTPLELYALGLRGTLPGLLHPMQDCVDAFTSGALVEGTDDFAGHRLLALRVGPPATAIVGTLFLNLTAPWSR